MPQLATISFQKSDLYIWNITESVSGLMHLWDEALPEIFYRYKQEIHRKQFLAKLLLLRKLHLLDSLSYLPNGKPVLSKGFISISHAGPYVAIAVSDQELGLDIEAPNPKLQKIASRFIAPEEIHLLDDLAIKNFQKLWTAKESIYKLMNQPGLRFRDQILVHWDKKNQKRTRAKVSGETKINLYFHYLPDDFIICQAFLDK